MSIIDYPLPSVQIMLTFGGAGLVCTLINLSVLKTGLEKKLKVNLVLGALGILFSAFLTLTPLLALFLKLPFEALATLGSGFLGLIMMMYGNTCLYRGARDNRPLSWQSKAIWVISPGLVALPVICGFSTEAVTTARQIIGG